LGVGNFWLYLILFISETTRVRSNEIGKKHTGRKCHKESTEKNQTWNKNSNFLVLAPFWSTYILETIIAITKYVSTLCKDYFIRNIEKKNNRDWLKNKHPTYKTSFLTSFGSLVSFVYFRSTNKNIHILLDHQMNIHAKFGSNWPNGFREEN